MIGRINNEVGLWGLEGDIMKGGRLDIVEIKVR